MMSVFSFSLVFVIGIFTDFLLAFSLVEIPTETEATGNKSLTEERHIYANGTSPGLGKTNKVSITIGLTIFLLLLLMFGLSFFAKEWYHSSHGYTIERMRRKGKFLPRRTDPRIEYGPDGRPNWIDCYGRYEAQDAVDMINTLALSHHRSYYYNGPANLAMYAIKGRELNSVNHAFEGFPHDDRPDFKYLQSGESGDGLSWRIQADARESDPEDAEKSVEDYSDYKAEAKDCSEETKNCNSSDKETDGTEEMQISKEKELPEIKPTSHGDVSINITTESKARKSSLCGLKST